MYDVRFMICGLAVTNDIQVRYQIVLRTPTRKFYLVKFYLVNRTS
jgi:hypothetical protein